MKMFRCKDTFYRVDDIDRIEFSNDGKTCSIVIRPDISTKRGQVTAVEHADAKVVQLLLAEVAI